MPHINETRLPGVGVRHEFETSGGDRLGTITHRSGRRDLLIFDRQDPDACARVLRLSEDDADTLSDLLGGSEVVQEQERVLRQDVGGLSIDWLPITNAWNCSGCEVGTTGLRTKTGATIVAVVRDGATLPVPDASFRLMPGDTAVLVGPPAAIEAAQNLLQKGQ
jgi:TrkA domain protein